MKTPPLLVLLPLILAAVGCETSLSDEAVRNYYRLSEKATLERKPKDLCGLLAADFSSTMTIAYEGAMSTGKADKAGTCAGTEMMYAAIAQEGENMDGILQLDSNYTIHSISLSPEAGTATVDISYSLDVAGSIINLRSRTTDTLILKRGKVLMLRSEGAMAMCDACSEVPTIPPMAKIASSDLPTLTMPKHAKGPKPGVASTNPATAKEIRPTAIPPVADSSAGVARVSLASIGTVLPRAMEPSRSVSRRVGFGAVDLRHCLAHQTNLEVARCVERLDPAPLPLRDGI